MLLLDAPSRVDGGHVAHRAPDSVQPYRDIGRHFDEHDVALAADDAAEIAVGDSADALGAGVQIGHGHLRN
jgi:hypothetical protein